MLTKEAEPLGSASFAIDWFCVEITKSLKPIWQEPL